MDIPVDLFFFVSVLLTGPTISSIVVSLRCNSHVLTLVLVISCGSALVKVAGLASPVYDYGGNWLFGRGRGKEEALSRGIFTSKGSRGYLPSQVYLDYRTTDAHRRHHDQSLSVRVTHSTELSPRRPLRLSAIPAYISKTDTDPRLHSFFSSLLLPLRRRRSSHPIPCSSTRKRFRRILGTRCMGTSRVRYGRRCRGERLKVCLTGPGMESF